MRAIFPTRLRNALIRTLLVTLSLAMAVVLYRIYDIKREVDEVDNRLSLEYGPQTTLIYDSKDRVISALFKEHRMPVMLEEMSEPLLSQCDARVPGQVRMFRLASIYRETVP